MAISNRLDDIVRLRITKGSTRLSTASFSIPLALVDSVAFKERVRIYTSVAAAGEDFGTDTKPYKMISALMRGTTRPAYVVVGRREATGAELDISFVGAVGAEYSMKVNGISLSYSEESGDTSTQVLEGIQEAYDAYLLTNPEATFSVVADTTGIQVVNNGEESLTITETNNIVLENIQSNESWVETLERTEEIDNTWYAVVMESHEESDVLAMAASIESRHKLFGTSSQDEAILESGDTDIASLLNEFKYENTFVISTTYADEDYPEAAWIGTQLPLTPGSNTWAWKGLPGVRASKISDTQYYNALRKKANLYVPIGGADSTLDGTVSSGEWIDTIVGIHWLYARMQEAVFFRLRNTRKIPYTRTGASIIEADIRGVLSIAVANGFLADDTPVVVISPDPLRVPPQERAERVLGDFKFTARFAGAVHRVSIDGNIEV